MLLQSVNSTRLAAEKKNTMVLAITKDLPFAHARFCTTEGITNVVTLSGFRDTAFGKSYGVEIIDGAVCRAICTKH